MRTLLKQDKGVAGLNLVLAVVISLFTIGLLIFIFVTIGGEIEETSWTLNTTTWAVATDQTSSNVTEAGAYPTGLSAAKLQGRPCTLVITAASNDSVAADIESGNYTITNCLIQGTAGNEFNNTVWNITGTATYDINTSSSEIMQETSDSLNNTTNWFTIIIVLSAMVVLIMLTVIIISAIKGSGLVGASGGESVSSDTA